MEEDRLNLAVDLALQAGAIIRSNFGKQHSVELKSDMSPVTAVDKQINVLVAQSAQNVIPRGRFTWRRGKFWHRRGAIPMDMRPTGWYKTFYTSTGGQKYL